MTDSQRFQLKPSVINYKGSVTDTRLTNMELENDSSTTLNPYKRPLQSPDENDFNKRYLFNNDTLITQNKFHALTQNEQQSSSQQTTTDAGPKLKIPPVFLPNGTNYQTIITDIKSVISNDFTTTYKGKELRLNLTSIDDYRKLTTFYDEHKVNYYTFQNPENSNISAIIRNVPISITEEEVNAE